jgi:hypothetical protein
MRKPLTEVGYEHTNRQLNSLIDRLTKIEHDDPGTDDPEHLEAVREGYHRMMGKLLRDLRLYEARHSLPETPSPTVAEPAS